MRKVLVVLVLLAVAISTYAQTKETPSQETMRVKVNATTSQLEGESLRLKGVSFQLQDGTIVKADEAFVNRATQEIELQGHVRMVLGPGARSRSGGLKP